MIDYLSLFFYFLNRIVRQICYEVDMSIQQRQFLNEFRMSGLPMLSEYLERFLKFLVMCFLYAFIFFPFSLISEHLSL
jgi:hypothetical protein